MKFHLLPADGEFETATFVGSFDVPIVSFVSLFLSVSFVPVVSFVVQFFCIIWFVLGQLIYM